MASGPRGVGSRGSRVRSVLIGRLGEWHAARFLRRRGLRVLRRNVRCGCGEVDIVAVDGRTVVFVEVKSRTQKSWSRDLEKVDGRKRRALRRTCRRLLASLGEIEAYRVDGVCVEFRSGRWLPRLLEIRWYPGILDLDS